DRSHVVRTDDLRCQRPAAQSESYRLSIADLRRCARGISYGALGKPRRTGPLRCPGDGRGRASVSGTLCNKRFCAGHRCPYKRPPPDSGAGLASVEATASGIIELIDIPLIKGATTVIATGTPGFQIKSATEADIPIIFSFIQKLARYERLSHEVVATEELLRKTLFGSRPTAEVAIGYLETKPVGF